jgi:hypothetical protein
MRVMLAVAGAARSSARSPAPGSAAPRDTPRGHMRTATAPGTATQHPLPHRHVWPHPVHQPRRPVHHPPPAAAQEPLQLTPAEPRQRATFRLELPPERQQAALHRPVQNRPLRPPPGPASNSGAFHAAAVARNRARSRTCASFSWSRPPCRHPTFRSLPPPASDVVLPPKRCPAASTFAPSSFSGPGRS